METIKIIKIDVPQELLLPGVEEKLDVKTSHGCRRITWTDQHGNETDIRELPDKHITHLTRWLVRNKLFKTCDIIDGELVRRQWGDYPPQFEEWVQDYKQHPETWRLKIYEQ